MVVSSVRESKVIPFLTLEIVTDEGIRGQSYIQAFNKDVAESVGGMLRFFENMLRMRSPLEIDVIWREMWEKTKLFGHPGIVTFAISLIDIALWDIKGKIYGEPIYKLLGGKKNSFEVYASDSLWLVSEKEALEQSEILVSSGFNSIKMRMGRDSINEDINVLRALREKWGNKIEIRVDVNQGWSMYEAESLIDELTLNEVYWLEEPLDTNDITNYSKLNDKSKTRICFGENLYGINTIIECIKLNTCSYLTPDLQRIGGITGWMKLSPILEYYKVPCSLHLFPEYSVHLLSVYPYADKIEWMSWSSELFDNPNNCKNGIIEIPQENGFGLQLKE